MTNPPDCMTEFLGPMRLSWGRDVLVFKVPLPERPAVFMSASPDSDLQLLVVKADRFLDLWRAAPHHENHYLAMGTPDSWRADRKYHQAESGFADGLANPVPVIEVSTYAFESRVVVRPKTWVRCQVERVDQVRSLSLGDGMTRTIWLLANGAATFPVGSDAKAAADLAEWGALASPPLVLSATSRAQSPHTA